jgi:exosortase C (VPDSG-CTERM-specific)
VPPPAPLKATPTSREGADSARTRFIAAAVVLVLAFAWPLWQWARQAMHSEMQSHVLLIPFISWYLLRVAKKSREGEGGQLLSSVNPGARQASTTSSGGSLTAAGWTGLLGLASLLGWWWGRRHGMSASDALSLPILALLLLLFAAALATLRWQRLRPNLFPIAFLIFMIPLPAFLSNGLSVMLQYASAEASNVTLRLTGMPVLRDGLSFHLPGLRIFVAEECSGIRSTLVLFITSLLGSYLFLRRGWSRAIFVFAVLPLGVFRNALRITTIAWLTVNVDSRVIDSPLHHRGGPVFFVISLVPLFLLLWWLRRRERRQDPIRS